MKSFTFSGIELNIAREAAEMMNDMFIGMEPEDMDDYGDLHTAQSLVLKLGGRINNEGYAMIVPEDTNPRTDASYVVLTDMELSLLTAGLDQYHSIKNDMFLEEEFTTNLYPKKEEYVVLNWTDAQRHREQICDAVDLISRIRLLAARLGLTIKF